MFYFEPWSVVALLLDSPSGGPPIFNLDIPGQ